MKCTYTAAWSTYIWSPTVEVSGKLYFPHCLGPPSRDGNLVQRSKFISIVAGRCPPTARGGKVWRISVVTWISVWTLNRYLYLFNNAWYFPEFFSISSGVVICFPSNIISLKMYFRWVPPIASIGMDVTLHSFRVCRYRSDIPLITATVVILYSFMTCRYRSANQLE